MAPQGGKEGRFTAFGLGIFRLTSHYLSVQAPNGAVALSLPHHPGEHDQYTGPKVFSNWVFGSSSFSFLVLGFVAHPGHASLRSLIDAQVAPLHAYVGSVVESPAKRRASRGAAVIFGFIHEPRPVRDDPARFGGGWFRSCRTLHHFRTEFSAICPHAV